MRTLNRNRQNLYYALLIGTEPVYALDKSGNPIVLYVDEDGNEIYQETGEYKNIYTAPIGFGGNIALSGGESEAVAYGLSTADYSAILVVEKGLLPITETSLIWHDTAPVVRTNGYADESSADYKVAKRIPSLNEMKYALDRLVK